jgi:hypothetical protein
MAAVAQEDTLKLRLGVPPRVQNLLCHNLVAYPLARDIKSGLAICAARH